MLTLAASTLFFTGNLSRAITVLVVAETVGKVYYHALRQATGSPLLRESGDDVSLLPMISHCILPANFPDGS